jgi:glutamate-1-semialdehyde 2,1-aminomutase
LNRSAQTLASDANLALDEAVAAARSRFKIANPKSRALFERTTAFMPGGNTRTTLFYPPFPLAMAEGRGCILQDVDGHDYVDFLGDFTAGLFGHSDPQIRAAIVKALESGLSLSAHNSMEGLLAELIVQRIPSIEKLRFTNSGTEANLMNLAVATNHTRRSKILVFEGAYHGSVVTFSNGPSPINVPHEFVVAPYNDIEASTALIRKHADSLAAVLVEPMLGASGCIPGTPLFLAALRKETEAVGALLIFDEVMTSRLAPGGWQSLEGISPDLTTLGKYIGGGMSFGAFGGRADLMAMFDPRRPDALPHAGTFNNNIITMAAGVVGMRDIFTPQASTALSVSGDALRAELNAVCRAAEADIQFTGFGSLMNMHPTSRPISNTRDLRAIDQRIRDLYFYFLLERGFYIARRGFVTLMLPIGGKERDGFVGATSDFIAQFRPFLSTDV